MTIFLFILWWDTLIYRVVQKQWRQVPIIVCITFGVKPKATVTQLFNRLSSHLGDTVFAHPLDYPSLHPSKSMQWKCYQMWRFMGKLLRDSLVWLVLWYQTRESRNHFPTNGMSSRAPPITKVCANSVFVQAEGRVKEKPKQHADSNRHTNRNLDV